MSTIINTSKPTTSVTNVTKISFGETWGSILTTWATETRTWAAMISLFTDTSKPTTSFTNVAKPS